MGGKASRNNLRDILDSQAFANALRNSVPLAPQPALAPPPPPLPLPLPAPIGLPLGLGAPALGLGLGAPWGGCGGFGGFGGAPLGYGF